MGCYNKIGFISSLPIEANDETVLIFMSKQNHSEMGGTVYPQDMYAPVFLPLFGRYDDYGKIDSVDETPIVKFIEEFFGEDIDTIISKVDDNSVGRGETLSVAKNDEVFQSLTFGLEHKSVYDKLASEFVSSDSKRFDTKVRLKRSYGSNDIRPNGKGFTDDFMSRYLAEEKGITYVDPTESFIELIGEDVIRGFLSFNDAMMVMNSKYFPSNYGSQSQDHVLHYKMLTLYRNLMVKRLAEYDEPEEIFNQLKSEIRDEKLSDIFNAN